MSSREKLPVCAVGGGEMKRRLISWEQLREYCQFHPEYGYGDYVTEFTECWLNSERSLELFKCNARRCPLWRKLEVGE